MESNIGVDTTLTRRQAKALLNELRAQYVLRFREHWHDDRFRLIPEPLRHHSMLAEFPVMAGQMRLISALVNSLRVKN